MAGCWDDSAHTGTGGRSTHHLHDRCENMTAETKIKICYSKEDPAAMLGLLSDCTLVLVESGSKVKAGKPDPQFSARQVFMICPVE